ncbi:MAG: hypothetical protein WA634_12380 [Silvibacterium sp.]
MLSDVIGSYVDSLTEREFDAPFIALLRLQGYGDIHFLHGPFEFGKDFIAKRTEEGRRYQYAFQTKAGDINLREWSACRGQIDMLRTNSLAHPNFDKGLSRRAVFVITGRLIGGAPLAAQEYREHLEVLGEAEFKMWDRDTLVDMLAVDPICLSGSPLGLLQILGSQHDQLNFRSLENYSRGWIRSTWNELNLRDSLEAAVIANHCRRENRIDLACYTALMLLRSTLATVHAETPLPESASVALKTAKGLFRYYAKQLWENCQGNFLDPDQIIQGDPTPAAFVTYPTRCLTVIEILGMLGLLESEIDEQSEFSREIAAYLEEFIHTNVGTTHPVSDRWCISLVPALLLLSKFGKSEAVRSFIRSTIRWIADYHDNGNFGLAQPHALPPEEVAYLLGPPFEQISLRQRSESYLAVTVLELASVLEVPELYDLARNEFLAVDIVLPVIETEDDQGQYCLHTGEHRFEPNMPFEEYWQGADGWKNAPHHHRGTDIYYPEKVGSPWDQLALSCVLRDRNFVKSWRRILGWSS